MKNIISIIFYGKYNRNTYEKHKNVILKNNLKTLSLLCYINIFLSLSLFVILLFLDSIKLELIYYISVNILVSLITMFTKRIIEDKPNLFLFVFYLYIIITMLIYKFISVSYGVNILLPILTMIYIVNAFMFIDKPFRYNFIMLFLMLTLCIMLKKDAYIVVSCFIYAFSYIIGCIISYFQFNDIIEKARVLHQTQKERDLDLLTKLSNKVSTERRINEFLSDPLNSGVLFVFDLDNFKEVNDTYGHIAGDEFLIRVAELLMRVFKKYDLISRFGGDEFSIFVEDITDKEFSISKAERLIKEIKNLKINRRSIVSCSIGITFSKQSDDFNSLFKRADEAMYEAKRSGKSCYKFYKEKK